MHERQAPRLTGTICKWFPDRGFGFIRAGRQDVFANSADVESGAGLREGDVVSFDLTTVDDGPYAGRTRARGITILQRAGAGADAASPERERAEC